MVHTDRTFENSVAAVRQFLGNEADRLLQGRVRLITVWRPFGSPVYNDPLAVCDWRSTSTVKDLIPYNLLSRHNVDEMYAVRYSEKHVWYYLEKQVSYFFFYFL